MRTYAMTSGKFILKILSIGHTRRKAGCNSVKIFWNQIGAIRFSSHPDHWIGTGERQNAIGYLAELHQLKGVP